MFDNNEKQKALEILEAYRLPTGGRYWWTQYPKRAVEEIVKLEDNTNARMTIKDGKLAWTEEIVNNFGTRFLISFTADKNHPYTAPKFNVIEPTLSEREKIHTWNDGSLCLMKPNEYSSSMTILEVRNIAAAWCFCVEAYANTDVWPGAEAPH